MYFTIAGWGGIFLILLLGITVGFSGSRLGICWVLLEKKYPECRTACRTPYPTIGYHAMGRPGKLVFNCSELRLGIKLFNCYNCLIIS